MQTIVECVPNFSNGRDPQVYNAIADAIRGVSSVRVLDVSADPDHNRTVITFLGTVEAVEEAAFRAIETAARLINMNEHKGEHPRIGATDVCPFIPIQGITMDDCVAMARRLGERVGRELGIAVYLYSAAATRPERESLAAIRKGEYELWKREIGSNPDRRPDFGPAEPNNWGATVIGARPFLIAYNLYLNTDQVEFAEKIARAVRFSSGGLRFVQARGFLVEGQAQVSMNLTDFNKTPVYRVQEMVGREAARYGLAITHSELVGLIPQKALIETAKWYLQLDGMEDNQVLESWLMGAGEQGSGGAEEQVASGRLRPEGDQPEGSQATDGDPQSAVGSRQSVTLEDFIEQVGAATAAPGGGAVAALAGALGAALAQMVAGLTIGRKKYADVDGEARRVLDESGRLRAALEAAIAEDSAAFEQVIVARRNKEADEATRVAAIEEATLGAAEVPLRVARLAYDVAHLARAIAAVGNVNAVTDAAAGAYMAQAAVYVAALNVKINVTDLQDQNQATVWREEVEALADEVNQVTTAVAAIAAERGGF
jgi:glutamate formiminotransferase/formiminotetrahydrofolate cyclodeaminase